jgi:anti-sigma factor RsiW
MKNADSHLSDQQLLLDVEGELSPRDENLVRAHLHACWTCRARRQELENAIVDFVRIHQQDLDAKIPPAAGPRALLKARIAELSATESDWRSEWFTFSRGLACAAAICGLLAFGVFLVHSNIASHRSSRVQAWIVSIPDSRLTPGATVLVSRSAVCAESNTKNKPVSAAVQRKVFEEYGIAGVDPRAYEVDYLVTPALGGADDIHNLWPHSYSATAWNARVKDALEDRLRGMVCDGSLDLSEAQREIASNWIAAYKKYFHTDQPLESRWR